jgi:hypothetical protein
MKICCLTIAEMVIKTTEMPFITYQIGKNFKNPTMHPVGKAGEKQMLLHIASGNAKSYSPCGEIWQYLTKLFLNLQEIYLQR